MTSAILSKVTAGLNRHSLGQQKTEPDYPSQDVDTSGGEVEFVRLGRLLRNVGNFGNFCNFCWLACSGFGNVGKDELFAVAIKPFLFPASGVRLQALHLDLDQLLTVNLLKILNLAAKCPSKQAYTPFKETPGWLEQMGFKYPN